MKKWQKKEALSAIDELISSIKNVQNAGRQSSEHTRWLANSLRILGEIFGEDSRYYLTMANFSWHETGSMLIEEYWDVQGAISSRHQKAFNAQLREAEGLLLSAKDHLKQSDISDVYEGKNTASEASDLITIFNLGENKLRKIIRSTPEREKEVQDRFEDLLVANSIDFSREFPHIEYSSKQYIPDFSFERISLAVEIKLCKGDEKGLIAQLNDDILAYKTKFRNILFVIYDLGQIRDVETFKKSFESQSNVYVQIIKQ